MRTDAPDHWKGKAEQKRRLHVSGLPRMADQYSADADIRNLFKGFKMSVVALDLWHQVKVNNSKVMRLARSSSHARTQVLFTIAIFLWISRPPKRLSSLVKLRMAKLPGEFGFGSLMQGPMLLPKLTKDEIGKKDRRVLYRVSSKG